MSDLVQLSKDNDIAIIMINNPPVNALSPGVPEGISEAIEQVDKDPTVKAAVLIGAGKTFVAGAGIKEFGKMTSGKTRGGVPFVPLLGRIEDWSKPVGMAIHGTAFGGGLELAMAGHYRVAAPTAQVGQPEVKLGIIPGAAGTQRLPRLAGVAKAVEMCADGNPIKAKEALALGIVDKLIDGDLLSGAVAFAREIAGKPARKTRERNEKLGSAEQNAPIFAAAREAARKKARGLMAPLAAIDAVEAATKLPFDQGVEAERKLFTECLFSDQSKAMIHVFFGEREVAKIPDVPKETPTIPVNSAAVIGAGTMGGGIAMNFANAGIPVLLKETDQAALDRGIATIRRNYEVTMSKGKMTAEQVERTMALITPTTSYDGFDRVDIVTEAVFENMALKKPTSAELGKVTRPDCILASNSSTLDIDQFAASSGRPAQVLGHHYFSPANVMKLMEIVRGRETSKEAIATSLKLAKKLGKVGVVVGNCFGFVANRMLAYYMREAYLLLEEGASVEQIDRVLTEFGLPVGPYGMQDIAGIDVGARIRQYLASIGKSRAEGPQSAIPDRLFEMGRYGQKTGAGWYKYEAPGSRNRTTDPLIEQLANEEARKRGITRRPISDEEVLARITTALANEGARVLEDKFATRPGDIDIIYAYGFGFPRHTGGPMFYAETVGLDRVLARVKEYRGRFGDYWQPAPMLEKLVAEGRSFYA